MTQAWQFHLQARASLCPEIPTAASRSPCADRGGHALARARRTYGHASSQRSMRPTRLSSTTATAPEAGGKSCARQAMKVCGARSARRSTWRASVPTSGRSDTTGWTGDARWACQFCAKLLSRRLIPLLLFCSRARAVRLVCGRWSHWRSCCSLWCSCSWTGAHRLSHSSPSALTHRCALSQGPRHATVGRQLFDAHRSIRHRADIRPDAGLTAGPGVPVAEPAARMDADARHLQHQPRAGQVRSRLPSPAAQSSLRRMSWAGRSAPGTIPPRTR